MIKVKGLTKLYPARAKGLGRSSASTCAVDNISFTIRKGEIFGLVGESGCGKSTTGKMLIQMINPTAGTIHFKGENLTQKNDRQLLPLRRNLQMIFQNPYGSLNPKMTIQQILEEPLKIHKIDKKTRRKKIQALLNKVGLQSSFLNRYPAEFSGGQRQRIAIARALALEPEFIVADEAVSALDVSIQAQILNLLLDLQKQLSLTMLFISHDLNVVQYISDRIAVMYLGQIVEIAASQSLYDHPSHPYSQILLASIPIPDPDQPFAFTPVNSEMESNEWQQGCHFYPRCPKRIKICSVEKPQLREIATDHFVACHLTNF